MSIFRSNATPTGPRRVLITGAASGFGLELAKRFVARGDHVIATDLHDAANGDVATLGERCTYRKLDVTSDADWEAAAAEVGAVDVLVLNAGIAVGGAIENVTMETWQRALDINLLGAVRGCRAFVPLLQPGAQIVMTSSIAGLIHPIKMSTYNATKAAVVALAETVDFELRERGITTTVVCPQFFRSNLADSLTGDDAEADDLARTLLTKTPLTAATVADRAMKGIDARRQVVTPDSVAVVGWYAKRFARPLYLAAMRRAGKGAKRLAARSR
ncbi:SDR family NAD(P)-dependent oxidoreductase [Corynebacterium sp. NPDC060344]|uniref:SDR family NAD(P)-dependent oxidoreductase n=1 Tax=Corynebacterium sp. NPDC060344 TaxID=3347101 RepID=UPI003645F7CE